jgi:DNA-binding LacI/PurR family transcriptional regulator
VAPGDRPDAVFVANDHMAIPVIDTLRSRDGPACGEDVSVVGYDDVPAAAWPAYSLTTVRQPAGPDGGGNGGPLLRMIEDDGTPPRNVEVRGELILRGSARIPEEWDKT